MTEKLTILLSTLIMIVVLIILGMVALFYLLFALAYVLEPLVGGLMVSFAIIAGINITDHGFSHYFPQAAYHLSHGKLPRQLIFNRFKINEVMSAQTPAKITLEEITPTQKEALE